MAMVGFKLNKYGFTAVKVLHGKKLIFARSIWEILNHILYKNNSENYLAP